VSTIFLVLALIHSCRLRCHFPMLCRPTEALKFFESLHISPLPSLTHSATSLFLAGPYFLAPHLDPSPRGTSFSFPVLPSVSPFPIAELPEHSGPSHFSNRTALSEHSFLLANIWPVSPCLFLVPPLLPLFPQHGQR